jgi:hypothetical protein
MEKIDLVEGGNKPGDGGGMVRWVAKRRTRKPEQGETFEGSNDDEKGAIRSQASDRQTREPREARELGVS